MNEKLSAFMDNELDELETRRLLASLDNDVALRQAWGRYHLIRAALRRESLSRADADVVARVHERLTASPASVIRSRRPIARWAGQLALAASVAAVAIVGARWWIGAHDEPTTVARTGVTPAEYLRVSRSHWDVNQREAEIALNAYLVEHNEFAPTSGVSGMLPYVRVAGYDSMDGGGRATQGAVADDSGNSGNETTPEAVAGSAANEPK